jgi:hypothetical protein
MPVSTFHQMFLDTRNKNMYGLEVGISMVFKIFRQFPIYGGVDTRGHINVLHILPVTFSICF